MLRLLCAILLLGSNALAYQVSKEGRADLHLVISHSKRFFPNRYKGVITDMQSLRASCVALNDQPVGAPLTEIPGFKIRVVNNQKLVTYLHTVNRQPSLLAILNDRRYRVNKALPSDLFIRISIYSIMGANYLRGVGPQFSEPAQLRTNMVGIFDDLISTVKAQDYRECINIIDDIVTPGVRI